MTLFFIFFFSNSITEVTMATEGNLMTYCTKFNNVTDGWLDGLTDGPMDEQNEMCITQIVACVRRKIITI